MTKGLHKHNSLQCKVVTYFFDHVFSWQHDGKLLENMQTLKTNAATTNTFKSDHNLERPRLGVALEVHANPCTAPVGDPNRCGAKKKNVNIFPPKLLLLANIVGMTTK